MCIRDSLQTENNRNKQLAESRAKQFEALQKGTNVPANPQQPKKKKKVFKPCTFEKQGRCNR
eukprot:4753519-Karenia_brevis.AAC.1